MKVLITGGAGYIGSELVHKLANSNTISEIVVYDNLYRGNYHFFTGVRKLESKKVRFVKGDILDGRKLRKTLEGIDTVFHLAANVTTPFADQNPHFFEQVNHWGTAELVYAVEQSDVSKFVYLSSTSVYGSQEEVVTIDTALNPKTFYGISKMRGEEHVRRLFTKMQTYIIRSGNVYGYSKAMRIDAVINKFMFDAQFANRITINGDGNQHRAFIEMGFLVDSLDALITSNLSSANYNLVDKTLSILEIADVLKDIYPSLEMVFVNQHLKMREIKVDKDDRINQLVKRQAYSLLEELNTFKKVFAF